MRKPTLARVLMLLALPMVQSAVQHSGPTSLLVRVEPVARIDPQQVVLHFRKSADGSSDLTTQAASVTAWVRALPGQRIRVAARLVDLEGPNGPIAISALRWTGQLVSATAGARQAACSSGGFGGEDAQDLVEGWERSGVLTCSVNFELTGARNLSPGLYRGLVKLSLGTQ